MLEFKFPPNLRRIIVQEIINEYIKWGFKREFVENATEAPLNPNLIMLTPAEACHAITTNPALQDYYNWLSEDWSPGEDVQKLLLVDCAKKKPYHNALFDSSLRNRINLENVRDSHFPRDVKWKLIWDILSPYLPNVSVRSKGKSSKILRIDTEKQTPTEIVVVSSILGIQPIQGNMRNLQFRIGDYSHNLWYENSGLLPESTRAILETHDMIDQIYSEYMPGRDFSPYTWRNRVFKMFWSDQEKYYQRARKMLQGVVSKTITRLLEERDLNIGAFVRPHFKNYRCFHFDLVEPLIDNEKVEYLVPKVIDRNSYRYAPRSRYFYEPENRKRLVDWVSKGLELAASNKPQKGTLSAFLGS